VIEELDAISDATGIANAPQNALVLAVARGDGSKAEALFGAAIEHVTSQPGAWAWARA
jgi:hypothetical protein